MALKLDREVTNRWLEGAPSNSESPGVKWLVKLDGWSSVANGREVAFSTPKQPPTFKQSAPVRS